MGSLKPGATLIYERNGDEVYAREFGETSRTLVGYNVPTPDPRTNDGRPLREHMLEDTMYRGIFASPIFLFLISSPALLNISVKDDSNTSIG